MTTQPVGLSLIIGHQFRNGIEGCFTCYKESPIVEPLYLVMADTLKVTNGERVVSWVSLTVPNEIGTYFIDGELEELLGVYSLDFTEVPPEGRERERQINGSCRMG